MVEVVEAVVDVADLVGSLVEMVGSLVEIVGEVDTHCLHSCSWTDSQTHNMNHLNHTNCLKNSSVSNRTKHTSQWMRCNRICCPRSIRSHDTEEVVEVGVWHIQGCSRCKHSLLVPMRLRRMQLLTQDLCCDMTGHQWHHLVSTMHSPLLTVLKHTKLPSLHPTDLQGHRWMGCTSQMVATEAAEEEICCSWFHGTEGEVKTCKQHICLVSRFKDINGCAQSRRGVPQSAPVKLSGRARQVNGDRFGRDFLNLLSCGVPRKRARIATERACAGRDGTESPLCHRCARFCHESKTDCDHLKLRVGGVHTIDAVRSCARGTMQRESE